MKLLRISKPLLLATALLFAFGMFLTSCQVHEPVEANTEAPQVAAKGSGYGLCSSCPFNQALPGGLYNHLYPNSPWMLAMESCFVEDLADFGYNCQPRKGFNTISTSGQVFLPGANLGGQSLSDYCSLFQSTWMQILSQRPSGHYYLVEVNDMNTAGFDTFSVQMTWQKYICEAKPTHK